jgi:hypothetical protein
MEKQIANYLETIGFTNPTEMAKFYMEYLKLPGDTDAMGLIDPHEIQHIRGLMQNC